MPLPTVIIAIYRSVLTFVILLILTRLMGKKQISQMTFFDYVVGITIGSIAASVSVELQETLVGLSSMAVWSLLTVFTGWFALKSPRFERAVQGPPVTLIKDGQIMERNLSQELLTTEDLSMKLRENGVFFLTDVEAAFLEPDGQVSVLLKGDRQPLTGKSTGIRVPPTEMPDTVILDGHIKDKALLKRGYSLAWLKAELAKQGINDHSQVIFAQIDESGSLWIDVKDDQMMTQKPQAKKMLLASLIQTQAQLEMFALETENVEAKALYSELADDADHLLEGLEPLLR